MYLLFTTIVRAIHCTPVAHNGRLRMMISILTQGFFLFFCLFYPVRAKASLSGCGSGIYGYFPGSFPFPMQHHFIARESENGRKIELFVILLGLC